MSAVRSVQRRDGGLGTANHRMCAPAGAGRRRGRGSWLTRVDSTAVGQAYFWWWAIQQWEGVGDARSGTSALASTSAVLRQPPTCLWCVCAAYLCKPNPCSFCHVAPWSCCGTLALLVAADVRSNVSTSRAFPLSSAFPPRQWSARLRGLTRDIAGAAVLRAARILQARGRLGGDRLPTRSHGVH